MKERSKNILLLGATVVFLLGMLEVGVRFFDLGFQSSAPQNLFVRDPELGAVLRPGFSERHRGYQNEYNVLLSINSLGLRDREFEKYPPAGSERILLLGDSFAYGYGVEASETFPKQWEQKLNSQGLRAVEVVNAGVPSYDLWQEVKLARRLIPKLHPDRMVIAFFMGNDVPGFSDFILTERTGYMLSLAEAERYDTSLARRLYFKWQTLECVRRSSLSVYDKFKYKYVHPYGGMPIPAFFESFRNWWENGKFRVPMAKRGVFAYPFSILGCIAHRPDFRYLVEESPWDIEGDWENVEAALAEFKKLSNETGISLELLYIPSFFQCHKARLQKMLDDCEDFRDCTLDLDLPTRRMSEICQRLGVSMWDSTPALRDAWDAGRPIYFDINMHFTPEGNRVMADYLMRQSTGEDNP